MAQTKTARQQREAKERKGGKRESKDDKLATSMQEIGELQAKSQQIKREAVALKKAGDTSGAVAKLKESKEVDSEVEKLLQQQREQQEQQAKLGTEEEGEGFDMEVVYMY